jgi:hypothetical protein
MPSISGAVLVLQSVMRGTINRGEPRDPHAIALALEGGVGDPTSPNVVMSRQRLRNLLAQAVKLGVEQQIAAREAAARHAAATFPSPYIRRGIGRAWAACIGVSAIWIFVQVAVGERSGFGTALLAAIVLTGMASIASYAAYHIITWVWRGFRREAGVIPLNRSGVVRRQSQSKVEIEEVQAGVNRPCALMRYFIAVLFAVAWVVPLFPLSRISENVNWFNLWAMGFPLGVWGWRHERKYASF